MDTSGQASLKNRLPIIPHEHAGVDCCGCIILEHQGNDVELRCNECGASVGVVNAAILSEVVDLLDEASRSYKLEASLPPNLERAALAQILTIADRPEDQEAALHDIQVLAVAVHNQPAEAGDYWHAWRPDPEHINALPQPLRDYIHDLETRDGPI